MYTRANCQLEIFHGSVDGKKFVKFEKYKTITVQFRAVTNTNTKYINSANHRWLGNM